jgi:hypothetical protein
VNSLVESTRSEIGSPAVLKKFNLPKLSWRSLPALLLIGLLILVLAYPIGVLFVKSFVASRPGQATVWTINGWVAAFTDATLPVALSNTFWLSDASSPTAAFSSRVVTAPILIEGFIEMMLWLGFFLPLLP